MNTIKDFIHHPFMNLILIYFILINLSIQYQLLSQCDAESYYYRKNSSCIKCPTNSTPDPTKFKCNCTNNNEYFNFTENLCVPCPEGFAVSPNLTYCYNCSKITGNDTDYFDNVTNKCKCGAGSVFFYTKNQCIMDNSSDSTSIDTSNLSLYENDYNKVCIGIGLIYNSSSDECECQNSTYRNITYKYNSTYNYIVCQPSLSTTISNTNNTRNLQATDLSYDPYNEEGERDTSISTSTTFLNEKIMNAYNYCIQAIDVMIFACNALANYCVLAMYKDNHYACQSYNLIFDQANDISQLELDAYNDYL